MVLSSPLKWLVACCIAFFLAAGDARSLDGQLDPSWSHLVDTYYDNNAAADSYYYSAQVSGGSFQSRTLLKKGGSSSTSTPTYYSPPSTRSKYSSPSRTTFKPYKKKRKIRGGSGGAIGGGTAAVILLIIVILVLLFLLYKYKPHLFWKIFFCFGKGKSHSNEKPPINGMSGPDASEAMKPGYNGQTAPGGQQAAPEYGYAPPPLDGKDQQQPYQGSSAPGQAGSYLSQQSYPGQEQAGPPPYGQQQAPVPAGYPGQAGGASPHGQAPYQPYQANTGSGYFPPAPYPGQQSAV